jgi:hypothetical protein
MSGLTYPRDSVSRLESVLRVLKARGKEMARLNAPNGTRASFRCVVARSRSCFRRNLCVARRRFRPSGLWLATCRLHVGSYARSFLLTRDTQDKPEHCEPGRPAIHPKPPFTPSQGFAPSEDRLGRRTGTSPSYGQLQDRCNGPRPAQPPQLQRRPARRAAGEAQAGRADQEAVAILLGELRHRGEVRRGCGEASEEVRSDLPGQNG